MPRASSDNVCDAYRHVAPHLPALLERGAEPTVVVVAGISKRSLLSASLALYTGLIAQALGARQVRLADARAGVRAHAERLGMTALEPSGLRGVAPAPLAVDASGHPRGLAAALQLTAEDGVCTSSGGLHASARIPTGLMYGRNVTYHVGRTHARTLIPGVLELMTAGRLPAERVTTHLGEIDAAPAAIRAHALGDATKTILVER